MLRVDTISVGAVAYYCDGRHPGRWSTDAQRLFGLRGQVDAADLTSLLRGRDPRSGEFLPAVRASRRRAGWDLAFCAPKSVSLAAADGLLPGEAVVSSHVDAVTAVLGHLGARVEVCHAASPTGFAPGDGLIAACFDHSTNAAGEPHIHTHCLVANLTRNRESWSALHSQAWTLDRAALASLYHLALRAQILDRFPGVSFRLHPDGSADLAGVARSSIRDASTQSRRPIEERRAPRRLPVLQRNPTPEAHAEALQHDVHQHQAVGAERLVTVRLAARRSAFRICDVFSALAASWPGGMHPPEAVNWVEAFCAASVPSPSPTILARWTTVLAQRADTALRSALDRAAAGPGLEVLGSHPGTASFVDQAEFLERSLAGRVAAVSAEAPRAQRWAAMAGIPAWDESDEAEVVIVDRADRRAPAVLTRVAEAATEKGARLVLVQGGTSIAPRTPAAAGLAAYIADHGAPPAPVARPWNPADRTPRSTGRGRAEEILSAWAEGGGVMTALGLQEVDALNRAAASIMGRSPGAAGFEPGDPVQGRRRVAGAVPNGAFGVVSAVSKGRVTVRWNQWGTESCVPPSVLSPAWAVGLRAAPRFGGRVLTLGVEPGRPALSLHAARPAPARQQVIGR